MLRVLLTNDDGIQSEGIRQLALQLSQRCDVTVIAPDSPASATSHSITLHKPLRLKPVKNMGYDPAPGSTLRTYHCNGTPADCVMLGVMHLCKDAPPHLVISGINNGINVAQDLTYSGTVGGALEGAILGVPSLAVSLDRHVGPGFPNSAFLVEAILCSLLFNKLPASFPQFSGKAAKGTADSRPPLTWDMPTQSFSVGEPCPEPGSWYPDNLEAVPCLNINLPDKEPSQIGGVCWTFGGDREYSDVIQEASDPRGRKYYWIGGEKEMDNLEHGGDVFALHLGYISVTPMTCDITSKPDIERFSNHLKERSQGHGGQ